MNGKKISDLIEASTVPADLINDGSIYQNTVNGNIKNKR